MRVLQIHTRYRQRGGEDVVVDAEAALLRDAGHEVRQVFAQNPTKPLASIGALALAPWNPFEVGRVSEAITEFRPDVAHVHNTWFAMSPAVIRALNEAAVPVVMTLHNYRLTCANGLLFRDGAVCEECVGTGPWNAVKHACYRDSRLQSVVAAAPIALHRGLDTLRNGVSTFVCLTEFQRDLMIRAGLPENKLAVKPNFVSDPGPRSMAASQSNLVMFVGRLSYEKGPDLLVDGWRHAATENLELVLVGDGPMRQQLELGAPTGVRFLGSMDPADVRSLMLQARAGVVPSRSYEGLPTVLLEFCAASIAIVMPTGLGAYRSYGEELDSPGFDIEERDSLVSALESLTDDRMCDVAGSSGRGLFEHAFSQEVALASLESVYDRVMS